MGQNLQYLERLCEISRKDNNKEFHLELVVRVLGLLGDSDPETTIRIASRNEKYFKNVQDDFTGDFYWAYGNALYKSVISVRQ